MKLYTLDNKFIEETTDARYPKTIPDNFTGIIEHPNKTKYWYLNGVLHRTDGPAIDQLDGTKLWYLYGQLHRIGGHAVEYPGGTNEWWINDKKISECQHKLLVDMMKLKGL